MFNLHFFSFYFLFTSAFFQKFFFKFFFNLKRCSLFINFFFASLQFFWFFKQLYFILSSFKFSFFKQSNIYFSFLAFEIFPTSSTFLLWRFMLYSIPDPFSSFNIFFLFSLFSNSIGFMLLSTVCCKWRILLLIFYHPLFSVNFSFLDFLAY